MTRRARTQGGDEERGADVDVAPLSGSVNHSDRLRWHRGVDASPVSTQACLVWVSLSISSPEHTDAPPPPHLHPSQGTVF